MASFAPDVSLHCIICFEEFDVKDRPPVVLPCGHTYVCIVCAKRLRRCMECREPLFWTPPVSCQKVPPASGINTRSPATARYAAARGRYSPGSQTPPGPPVKEEPVPLPLPKNIVLMEMIEATQRQARLIEESRIKQAEKTMGFDTEGDGPRENDTDIEYILRSLNSFTGSSGTYAVREALGLAVLPFDPNKNHQPPKEGNDEDEDEEKKIDESREPFTIEQGQTVQVVGVDEGVYQLARGAGFIVASVNQLVKVGGPMEKSCEYEGLLKSVLKKQEELQHELQDIDGLVDELQHRIEIELESPPEYPIISPPKESEELGDDESDSSSGGHGSPSTPRNARPDAEKLIRSAASTSSTEVNLGTDPKTPARDTSQQPGDSYYYENSPAYSCPMPVARHDLLQPSMDSAPAGLPRYRVTSDDDMSGLPWSFGCGSALFGERLIEQDCDAGAAMSLSFDDSLVGGARAVASQSLAARTIAAHANLTPGDSSLRSGSFDGPVNFRTGMSGHTGLNVSRKKSSPMSRPHIRMMSEHRGIAASARPINNHHQNFQSQARRLQGMGRLPNSSME